MVPVHAMKANGCLAAVLYSIFTSALDKGEWSSWRPGRLTSSQKPSTHWTGGSVCAGAALDRIAPARRIILHSVVTKQRVRLRMDSGGLGQPYGRFLNTVLKLPSSIRAGKQHDQITKQLTSQGLCDIHLDNDMLMSRLSVFLTDN